MEIWTSVKFLTPFHFRSVSLSAPVCKTVTNGLSRVLSVRLSACLRSPVLALSIFSDSIKSAGGINRILSYLILKLRNIFFNKKEAANLRNHDAKCTRSDTALTTRNLSSLRISRLSFLTDILSSSLSSIWRLSSAYSLTVHLLGVYAAVAVWRRQRSFLLCDQLRLLLCLSVCFASSMDDGIRCAARCVRRRRCN